MFGFLYFEIRDLGLWFRVSVRVNNKVLLGKGFVFFTLFGLGFRIWIVLSAV